MTKQKPWSITIKKRRLSWAGHLMRLNEHTPARIALNKFAEPHKNKVGRPKTTWLATIKRDLKEHEMPKDNQEFIMRLWEMTSDRAQWNGLVDRECGMVRKD